MPFVARKIEPRYLCRGHVPTGPGAARDWPVAAELEAAAHGALTGALKQLASLLGAAEDVFAELTAELTGIAERGAKLRIRIDRVEARLAQQDPKKIPVPESDICTFALRTEHFKLASSPSRCLFTLDTRPKALRQLYEAAAAVAVRSLDSLRRDRDATSSIDMFMCTPILGKRRRDHSLDIESRVPRAIEELRRWTSAEALGDVTVTPDCTSRITMAESLDDSRPVDHKLPSPEEQLQAIALKFPAEIVAVDVSGRGFQRMSMRRRSMHTGQDSHETVKRRSRPRRPRGKRRNTIAGTDQKEIRQAVGGETTADEPEEAQTSGAGSSSTSKRAHRSASTDLLGSGSKKDSPVEKKSHFDTLKAWGRSRLKLISPKSSQQHAESNGSTTLLSSPSSEQTTKSSRHSGLLATEDEIRSAEETVVGYETPMGSNRRPRREQSGKSSHERKASSSSSSGKSVSSQQQQQQLQQQKQQQLEPSDGAATTESQPSLQPSPRQAGGSVRLRESAAERRERRKARADEPPHSSSGNWSASSESGRASIGSETTTTTHPPKSTTTASIGTSSTSLSHARRFKGRDTSASSSVTSEGTLTPDIIQDINAVPFSDDGETSSVYSCDTEGYYTSFHMDSGLKTLREEELPAQPQSPLTKSNEVQSDPTSPIAENEYELYGRGSTSTTTSSAGTVCTTLMAPPPPERKSSLTVVAMVHGQKQNGGESPDSGHNTSSSPVESASSPACTGRSCSEFEYSESSDLEGCERIERIRSKTAINTSRIPSMCVITPPGSDDENQQKDAAASNESKDKKKESQQGAVLMSATVGTSKMEVINGQDKNLYATVQTVMTSNANSNEKGQVGQNIKISPLSGVLGKLRGVLPGRKHQQKPNQEADYNNHPQSDSGDYVTIADVRNNNDKRTQDNTTTPTTIRPSTVTYANADIFKRDAEYVSLSELPKKPDSSLERRRQGARVTLDSEGKVVYSSDSLKRRKGAHTTFIPGPFVKEGPSSPAPSPLLHRAQITPRAVQRTAPDAVDGEIKSVPEPIAQQQQQQQQHGKVIIRAAKSPDRSVSPDYVRTPSTVVGPSSCSAPLSVAQRQSQRQGAYVNVQGASEEGKTATATGLNRLAVSNNNNNNNNNINKSNNNKINNGNSSCNINNNNNNSIRKQAIVSVGKSKAVSSGAPARLLRSSNAEVRGAAGSGLVDNVENKPPNRHPMSLRFRHKPNSLERKILKPNARLLNNGFSKSELLPQSLKPSGNTPKLTRRLAERPPAISAPKPPSLSNGNGAVVPSEASPTKPADQPDSVADSPRVERKLKRSESYRMANSPIMFIKRLSHATAGHQNGGSERSPGKIVRSASEELREDLLKESINYPESVASPEPSGLLLDELDCECEEASGSAGSPSFRVPQSPRPRATDLEPARVLKYLGASTEIW